MPFGRYTYEEAVAKARAADERRRARKGKRSAAAKAGAVRRAAKQQTGDEQWKEWERQVFERDGYKCQFPGGCKNRGARLVAHHKNERSQRTDLKYVVSNGITLCVIEHNWVHANPAKAVAMGLLIYRSRELAMKEGTIGVY